MTNPKECSNPKELADFIYSAMVFLDTIHNSRVELTELEDLEEYTYFVVAAQKLREVKDELEKTPAMNATIDTLDRFHMWVC